MEAEHRNIPLGPGGDSFPAVRVNVDSEAGFTEVKLDDGTVLRVKPTVIDAFRFEDRFDASGNPVYNVTTAIITTLLVVPDKLKKQ